MPDHLIDASNSVEARFICFEGIDGSGKSSLALALAERLRREGRTTIVVDKQLEAPQDPLVSWEVRALGDALWRYPKDADIGRLGSRYWLGLIALWFELVDRCLVRPSLERGITVIAGGWCYKYAARFSLKPEIGDEDLKRAFLGLTEPDEVILLDIEPAAAMERRQALKPSEAGAADGYGGDPRSDFIAYQGRVREQLRKMAELQDWTEIGSADEDLEGVLERALGALQARTG
ncbi:MAG TPA: hypothetical protein VF662_13435 [Allosphingosinicella sp.]|jgi:thymidylate kinase